MNTSDFKIARRWNALNRLLQVVLSVTLVVGLNILAWQSGIRFRRPLPFAHTQTLALETVKQLESAARRAPPKTGKTETGQWPWLVIYDIMGAAEASNKDKESDTSEMLAGATRRLLDDFVFAAGKPRADGWLSVVRTDSLRRADIYARLQKDYDQISPRTALVVECKGTGRHKIINIEDLRVLRSDASADVSTAIFPNAFRGEDALISAILGVTDTSLIVYHTIGHREMSPDDNSNSPRAMSAFAERLRRRNISLRPLDLSKVNEVPTDANLVLVAAPQAAFAKSETAKLIRHMRRAPRARFMVFAEVGADPNLTELFDEWGILADDALIWDPELTTSRGLTIAKRINSEHDLTRVIAQPRQTGGGGSLAYLLARPVRRDPGAPKDETLRITELFTASADKVRSWGERDYRQKPFRNDPLRGDLEAPVPLAAVAERRIGRNLGIKAAVDGRILVLGSGDFASNACFREVGNEIFLLNAVNWMLDRDDMLNILPRPLAKFQLRATESDLSAVTWRFLLIPFLVLLFGFLISFWRKHT
ncbi:MAG: GldG family protein [Puniceicoccales bacterium]|jgi:hypothetical protein|nr:GldG family protein [Puniceicoccales bacterium]